MPDRFDMFEFDSKADTELLSVGALLRRIENSFQSSFSDLRLEGEIHAIKSSPAGHVYIDLKDKTENAMISACLFRNARLRMAYRPKVGDVVEARGEMNVYAARGSMSFIVRGLKPAGEGDLYARFVALKNRLLAEGFFSADRKKQIPRFPSVLGVVTSPEAAALRDVVKTVRSMAPHVRIVLYPAGVQGETAAGEIIDALKKADARREADVILLVRGGGSLADLWGFNSEALARTVAQMRIPVIAGIGHETDITIADMVSDFRAATPTAAAQKVCEHWVNAKEFLTGLKELLRKRADAKLRFSSMSLKLVGDLKFPMLQYLKGLQYRVNLDSDHLAGAPKRLLQSKKTDLAELLYRFPKLDHAYDAQSQTVRRLLESLGSLTERSVKMKTYKLALLQDSLRVLDPMHLLSRGFAMVTDSSGKRVKSATELSAGDLVRLHFSDSVAQTRIESVQKQK